MMAPFFSRPSVSSAFLGAFAERIHNGQGRRSHGAFSAFRLCNDDVDGRGRTDARRIDGSRDKFPPRLTREKNA